MDERNLQTSDLAGAGSQSPQQSSPAGTEPPPAENFSSSQPGARPTSGQGGDESIGAEGQGIELQGTRAQSPPEPLLPDDQSSTFRDRWDSIQAGFVDEPRHAVEQADTLVAEVMQRLAERFATTRSDLESQWASGADAGTEDLRQALQRYRSFFEVLLRR